MRVGRSGNRGSAPGRGGNAGRNTDRLWQGGFLVGAAIGAAATVIGRRAERSARRGLVDWPAAEAFAIGRLRRAPGALSAADIAASNDAYATAMALITPKLAEALGTELPGVVERAVAVDRAGWIRANVTTFASLIGHLEGRLLDQVVPPGGGLAHASMAIANRYVTTRQLGFLLGFLGTRVLGQYDIALLSAEAMPGKLLFVEENIRGTAAGAGRPARRLPDVDRPPRDDPRVRVRGPSMAATLPGRAARTATRRVQRRPRRGIARHDPPGGPGHPR
jgi:hypothetical protein